MNYFYLDEDVTKNAQSLHDAHLRKMIVETAQLLCAAYHLNTRLTPPCKLTHKNHPVGVWVRSRKQNFNELYTYLEELLKEYEYRFDKEHKSKEVLEWVRGNFGVYMNCDVTFSEKKERVLCMPERYKVDSVVESYRNYYNAEKLYDKNGKFIGKYTRREKPEWLREGV